MRVGIDFGTTNSGIAIADGEQVHTFQVDLVLPDLLPSIIYITKYYEEFVGSRAQETSLKQNTGRPSLFEKQWVGEVETWVATHTSPKKVNMDVYVWVDVLAPGRLLHSVKTTLRSQDYEGTSVFGKFYAVEQLVGILLKHLVDSAEAVLGKPVREAVIGRPVTFSENEEIDQRAEEVIRAGAKLAGIERVHFLLEPIAAAYTFHQELDEQKCVLVFDFGGGTLDLTLALLGGDQKPQILATEGVLVGGDDFDRRLLEHLLPHFGLGATLSDGKPIPAYIWDTVLNWEAAGGEQKSSAVKFVQEAVRSGRSSDPRGLRNLEELLTQNFQYKLLQEAVRAKLGLSNLKATMVKFSEGTIDFLQLVTRSEFERLIQPEIRRIEEAIDRLIERSGRKAEEVELVVKTGGSSQVPVFSDLLASKFPSAALSSEEETVFTGVVQGLAIFGHELDQERDAENATAKARLLKEMETGNGLEAGREDKPGSKIARLVAGIGEEGTLHAHRWPGEAGQMTEQPLVQGILCSPDTRVLLGTLWSRFFWARAASLLELTEEREKTPAYLRLNGDALDGKYVGDRYVLIARWEEVGAAELLLLVTTSGNVRHFPLQHVERELEWRRVWGLTAAGAPDIPSAVVGVNKASELLFLSESGRAVRTTMQTIPLKGRGVIKLAEQEPVHALRLDAVERCIAIDRKGAGLSFAVADVRVSATGSSTGKAIFPGGGVAALLPDRGKKKGFALTSAGRVVELDLQALQGSTSKEPVTQLQDREVIVNCWPGHI